MQTRRLGELWPVSALSLSGSGVGGDFGATTREEALATIRLAAERGVDFFNLSPLDGRGHVEALAGAAFDGAWPSHIRVATRCVLSHVTPDKVHARLETSLRRSLKEMGREQADLFFLHSCLHPQDYVFQDGGDTQASWALPFDFYIDAVVPALERIVAQGLAAAWGISAIGLPRSLMEAVRQETGPAAIHTCVNLMDSAGSLRLFEEPAEPRNIIRTAANNDVGVIGIRVFQGGALTAKPDRALGQKDVELTDYRKAQPFRAMAAESGDDPALLACRYALSVEGVATLSLGVKNRAELELALRAEEQGPLPADLLARIEALGLRRQIPRLPLDAPI